MTKFIDQNLFDNLGSALAYKQEIINNKQAYYHTTMVKVKHARAKILGIFKDNPYYTSHEERIFNNAKYNQDLADADSRIFSCQEAINNVISELESQANKIASKKDYEFQEIAVLKSKIDSFKSNYSSSSYSCNSNFNNLLQQEKAKLNQLLSEISKKMANINILSNQIEQEKSAIEQEKGKIEQLSQEFSALSKDLFNIISNINDEQRAVLIGGLLARPNSNELITLIKKLGFNPNRLAEIAISKSHNDLLDLAIEYKADLDNYQAEEIGNKTLAQYAISIGSPKIIAKILATLKHDCTCTLLNALKQDDIVTIKKLFTIVSALSHKLIHGYPLLHIAIWSGKNEIAKAIIESDKDALQVLNFNGESAYEVAISSSNADIIELLDTIKLSNQLELSAAEGQSYSTSNLFQLSCISKDKALSSSNLDFQYEAGNMGDIDQD